MTPSTLVLTGQVNVKATAQELYEDLGRSLQEAAVRAVQTRSMFHLALSGGSTPKPFYQHLAQDDRYRDFPWLSTHVWIVDERRVNEDDERNNFRMIRQALTAHIEIPTSQIHPVPVMTDYPAAEYEQQLNAVFDSNVSPRLDFVLLGMGDDAHTASLFPESPALTIQNQLIANNAGPQVTPPPRITMTYPLLNAARHVAVLVVGSGKAATLRRVDEQLRHGGPDPQLMPITGVQPNKGQMTWYLDTAAADLPD